MINIKILLRIIINYRIRSSITTGLYFSIWVFGWGSIQKIPQKGDFLTKKWGSIQEKAQKQDFWKGVRLYSRVGLYSSGYGISPAILEWSKNLIHILFCRVIIEENLSIFGTYSPNTKQCSQSIQCSSNIAFLWCLLGTVFAH